MLFGYAWWAPLVLAGAWLATHWLLRESAVWQDRNTDEVRAAQRARRLRLPAGRRPAGGQGAALFGLADWTLDRFAPAAGSCTSCSTRRPGCASGRWLWSLLIVVAANVARVLVAGRDAASTARSTSAGRRVRPGRRRHVA